MDMSPHQQNAPEAHILIVDDTLVNQRQLSQGLAKRGYETRSVPDGPQALAAVQSTLPDLILLDIQMPDMDGYEVCRQLKADERCRDIPIIFISSMDQTRDIVNAFIAGGVDYITKPFKFEEVVARVETHLSLRDLQRQLEQSNVELGRNIHELDTLRIIAQTLNQATALEEATQSGLETILILLGAQAGWLTLMDQLGTMRLAATYHLPPTVQDISNLEGTCSSCEFRRRFRDIALTEPAIVPECALLRQIYGSNQHLPLHISIPLQMEGRTMGMLNLLTAQERVATENERRLLRTIGDQYSATIERARLFEDVQTLATTDPLTDLFNRRHFFALGEQVIRHARRYDRPLSAILYDIDRFKRVNDTYGHSVGDQVLRTVADRCQAVLRQPDLQARYGGEEFVILLPETGPREAQQVAERLRQHVAEPAIETDGGPVSVAISLGVAGLDEWGSLTLDELLKCADDALYESKRNGRDRVTVRGCSRSEMTSVSA